MEKHYFKKINYWIITVAFIATFLFSLVQYLRKLFTTPQVKQRTSAATPTKTLQYKVDFTMLGNQT
jgi:primosomal protein N''